MTTREEIIKLAKEAGIRVTELDSWGIVAYNGGKFENIERFATLLTVPLQAEIDEQCLLNSMGSEREAKLMARVETQAAQIEKLREALEYCLDDSRQVLHDMKEKWGTYKVRQQQHQADYIRMAESALSLPSNHEAILQERDNRVAEACAKVFVSRGEILATDETASIIRSGEWKRHLGNAE